MQELKVLWLSPFLELERILPDVFINPGVCGCVGVGGFDPPGC